MGDAINPVHLIAEMAHDVRERDSRKAGLVLAWLPKVDENTQLAILRELASGDPDFSLPLFATVIAEYPMMEMEFPELRQWMGELAASSPQDMIKCINESRGRLRSVLVTTAAEIGMEDVEEVLLNVLNQERDPSVLSSIIEALGEVGGDESVESVAEYLYVTDDDLFASAARALARMGSPQAVEQLRRRMGIHQHLDEIVVGILWEVQSPESLKAINSVLGAGHAAVRSAARQALRMTGVKALPILLDNLELSDDDVKVHTLELLGDIGDESAYRSIRHLLSRSPGSANVRFAAYEALGKLPMQGRGFALAAGLEDQIESVRTAAAAAIEKNLDAALLTGVKNMADSGVDSAQAIARAAAEARAVNLSAGLAEASGAFREKFLSYLKSGAHPDTRRHFADVFKAEGRFQFAKEIAEAAEAAPKARKRIAAVDDSQMILRIYKTALHQIGFEPVTFDSPLAAVEAIAAEPPVAVLTDLNMPEITGVELIRRVREFAPKDTMPIVMVTTQQKGEDFGEAVEAGVNKVIPKPFTAADLLAVLGEFGVAP